MIVNSEAKSRVLANHYSPQELKTATKKTKTKQNKAKQQPKNQLVVFPIAFPCKEAAYLPTLDSLQRTSKPGH